MIGGSEALVGIGKCGKHVQVPGIFRGQPRENIKRLPQVLGALDCLPKVDQRDPVRGELSARNRPVSTFQGSLAVRFLDSAGHATGAERFVGASLVVKKIAEVEIALRMKLPDGSVPG